MLQEKVIIQQVFITQMGQFKTFQVRMPSDAKKIIGFEASIRGFDMDDGFDLDYLFIIRSVAVAGELRIQNLQSANLFYSTEVKLSDRNLGFGDFTQYFQWVRKAWTHDYQREEDTVHIHESSPILQGSYRDKIGEASHSNYTYTVNIYVWYSTEDLKNNLEP